MESTVRPNAPTRDQELSDADLDIVVGGLTTPAAPVPLPRAAWRTTSAHPRDDRIRADLDG